MLKSCPFQNLSMSTKCFLFLHLLLTRFPISAMPESNCTVNHLALPDLPQLKLTRLLTLLNMTLARLDDASSGDSQNGSALHDGLALTSQGHDLRTGARDTKDDFRGAMKFTVAVVMLYGIGVILMLGFQTKKSKRAVSLDFCDLCHRNVQCPIK